jgi:hypothetical protein
VTKSTLEKDILLTEDTAAKKRLSAASVSRTNGCKFSMKPCFIGCFLILGYKMDLSGRWAQMKAFSTRRKQSSSS